MSKGDGLKIGIKFTDDLVGDILENESAFTITGKEYKYVGGSLLDKIYQIENVSRYPTAKIWISDFNDGTISQLQITPSGLTLGVS